MQIFYFKKGVSSIWTIWGECVNKRGTEILIKNINVEAHGVHHVRREKYKFFEKLSVSYTHALKAV